MKILYRLVHVSDSGNEHIMHEEDIGEVLNDKSTKIIAKAFDLAQVVSNENKNHKGE